MTKIEYLQQRAAKADRLARGMLDALTVERLQAFAAECREQIKTLSTTDRIEPA